MINIQIVALGGYNPTFIYNLCIGLHITITEEDILEEGYNIPVDVIITALHNTHHSRFTHSVRDYCHELQQERIFFPSHVCRRG